eukprot:6820897-Alexandrium_andersonii.AAC.1
MAMTPRASPRQLPTAGFPQRLVVGVLSEAAADAEAFGSSGLRDYVCSEALVVGARLGEISPALVNAGEGDDAEPASCFVEGARGANC